MQEATCVIRSGHILFPSLEATPYPLEDCVSRTKSYKPSYQKYDNTHSVLSQRAGLDVLVVLPREVVELRILLQGLHAGERQPVAVSVDQH